MSARPYCLFCNGLFTVDRPCTGTASLDWHQDCAALADEIRATENFISNSRHYTLDRALERLVALRIQRDEKRNEAGIIYDESGAGSGAGQ